MKHLLPPTASRDLLRLFTACLVSTTFATEWEAANGQTGDGFGTAVALSDEVLLISAPYRDVGQGTVYVVGDEESILSQPDPQPIDFFGISLAVSGRTGLIGSNNIERPGTAYVFRDLGLATGTILPSATLSASDGQIGDNFGYQVSIAGSIGLVGNLPNNDEPPEAVYLFRGLDTATGAVNEVARLSPSSGSETEIFGTSVSVSGTIGLVGTQGGGPAAAAYVFRNLDTAEGDVTEDATLTFSDASEYSNGISVSVSGTTSLVGAPGNASVAGGAYLFRNLDTAEGTVEENARLVTVMGALTDAFGVSVSLDGGTALVGAPGADDDKGAAYLFRNLDTATGTVTESLKLTAVNGAAGNEFGSSVSLHGDHFVVGAPHADGVAANAGTVYGGSVSSMATLDKGDVIEEIGGLSFVSQQDWTIGKTTDFNIVELLPGSIATIERPGSAVYIGSEAGSDFNLLEINGTLLAWDVYVGAFGTEGNTLAFTSSGSFDSIAFWVTPGNFLAIEGDYTDPADFLGYLDGVHFQAWDGAEWQTVDAENYSQLVDSFTEDGFTYFTAVPEPGTVALLVVAGLSLVIFRKSRASSAG